MTTPEKLAELFVDENFPLDTELQMDGLKLLKKIKACSLPCVFFDPQYRGILDKMSYGNEGVSRGRARAQLQQMSEPQIVDFCHEISRVLGKQGHLFLWLDKYHLLTGFRGWFEGTALEVVDMIVWDKVKMGMGYRTRKQCEYLVIAQKRPLRTKGIWTIHNIRDIWQEKIKKTHAHSKPVALQSLLIEAVTVKGDIVGDFASGGFSVLAACQATGRHFLGCDLATPPRETSAGGTIVL